MTPFSHLRHVAAVALLARGLGAAEAPPLEVVPWLGYDTAAPLDRGRGVVAFSEQPTSLGQVDSLPILASPAPGAPIQACFLQRFQEDTSPYALAAPPGSTSNLVEFDYEVMGLPVDSLGPKAAWARVVYAFDGERRPRLGWVSLGPPAVRLVLWADLLPSRDLFLLDSVPWEFSDRPLGSPIPFAAPPSPHDYALHPLTTRGAWLQVRIVVPSDVCVEPQPGVRTAVGWVRYVDARGRPRVWFSPRGC
jgi:hypothetical protein